MPVQNAYCNECATRVMLAENGECENGHPRSALRDVQSGPIGPVAAPMSAVPHGAVAGSPNLTGSQEAASKTMGWLIVGIPVAIVIVVGLWSGYAASVGMGMSKTSAWLSSIGSLALTGVFVAFLVWNRRRKL